MTRLSHALFVGIVVAVLLGLGGCAAGAAPSPTVVPTALPTALPAEVSVTEAAALRDGGALMLDVREVEEWDGGHIAGAKLIPLGQLAGRLGEVPRDRTIVTVCRTGHRAAQARDILLGARYTTVATMTGGMNEWVAAGLQVVTGP